MGEKYRCTKSREIEISVTRGTRRIEETFPSSHVIRDVHNTMSIPLGKTWYALEELPLRSRMQRFKTVFTVFIVLAC